MTHRCVQSGVLNHSRREFLAALTGLGMSITTPKASMFEQGGGSTDSKTKIPEKFRVWVFSDAHVARDKKYGPRDSLADAIR
jgi:hypothetical protein